MVSTETSSCNLGANVDSEYHVGLLSRFAAEERAQTVSPNPMEGDAHRQGAETTVETKLTCFDHYDGGDFN